MIEWAPLLTNCRHRARPLPSDQALPPLGREMNLSVASLVSKELAWSEHVETAVEHRIQLAPRCSLTAKGAWVFWLSAALAPTALGIAFAMRGFWPILPFAGLELAGLGAALWISMRRGLQQESISITPSEIAIECRIGQIHRKIIFSRHWTRVKLHAPLHQCPSRLTLESHGQGCEVGRFLTEAERCNLAARLQQLVGNMNESPPL